MSIGAVPGLIGSAAGAPLSQTKGSEVERAQQTASAQQRQAEGAEKAELAAGIGHTDEDQEASDRDADGRRIWEINEQRKRAADQANAEQERKSKDASGQSGNQLDLSG